MFLFKFSTERERANFLLWTRRNCVSVALKGKKEPLMREFMSKFGLSLNKICAPWSFTVTSRYIAAESKIALCNLIFNHRSAILKA